MPGEIAIRTEAGRFRPGVSGNPRGRAPRVMEDRYLVALSRAVPLKKWISIARKAVEQAEAGDPRAREWLGRYLLPAVGNLSENLSKSGSAPGTHPVIAGGGSPGRDGTCTSAPDFREIVAALSRARTAGQGISVEV